MNPALLIKEGDLCGGSTFPSATPKVFSEGECGLKSI
jgi:hypothetical protein